MDDEIGNEGNEGEDYNDYNDPEPEEYIPVQQSPRSLVKTKSKPSKFKLIYKAAQAEQAMRKTDQGFMKQVNATDTYIPTPTTKRRRKKPRLAEQTLPEPLAEPIGFKDETLQDRITNSKATEFDVKRLVTLKHNRFVPFGTPEFYNDTASFYHKPTELCCLWCTEPFDGLPVPLPHTYKERPGEGMVFRVSGQFCSPSCMLAKARQQLKSLAVPRLMLKKVYGINMSSHIEPAPPVETLKKYGGIYTIKQFRATGATGIVTSTIRPPFLPLSAGITEIERTETTVTEVGGKSLATRVLCARGIPNLSLNSTPFHSFKNEKSEKQGKFVEAPTVEDQICASNKRLRLQRHTENEQKPRGILDFMNLRKDK